MLLLSSELSRDNHKPSEAQTRKLSYLCDSINMAVRNHDGEIDDVTGRHIKEFVDLVIRKIDANPEARFYFLVRLILKDFTDRDYPSFRMDRFIDENNSPKDVGLQPTEKSDISFSNRIITEITNEAKIVLADLTTWDAGDGPESAPMLDSAFELLDLLYYKKVPVVDILLKHVVDIRASCKISR